MASQLQKVSTAKAPSCAYLDIETTGLYPSSDYITVIGIHLEQGGEEKTVQLVDRQVTRDNLLSALQGVATVFTYNGHRFDLPFINHRLNVDVAGRIEHRDLLFDCWRNNLYGGLKHVERQLGICRQVLGVDGREAINLWWRFKKGDPEALETLLAYNREDLLSLKQLRSILCSGQ